MSDLGKYYTPAQIDHYYEEFKSQAQYYNDVFNKDKDITDERIA